MSTHEWRWRIVQKNTNTIKQNSTAMEVSPMPPISEDCSSQGESEMGDENDSNFEQLMVSMLEERDKVCYIFKYIFLMYYKLLYWKHRINGQSTWIQNSKL